MGNELGSIRSGNRVEGSPSSGMSRAELSVRRHASPLASRSACWRCSGSFSCGYGMISVYERSCASRFAPSDENLDDCEHWRRLWHGPGLDAGEPGSTPGAQSLSVHRDRAASRHRLRALFGHDRGASTPRPPTARAWPSSTTTTTASSTSTSPPGRSFRSGRPEKGPTGSTRTWATTGFRT